jgi:hypothetical protein
MGLKDRFRIDELVKKGSKAIPRDKRGELRVRKKDGKAIPTGYSKDNNGRFAPQPSPFIPYGQQPIKHPGIPPELKRFKSDFVDTLPPLKSLADLEAQKSFGGETSGFIEKPNYDENQLKRALDVKVDELIKPVKPKRGDFIPKPRYVKLENLYKQAQTQIKVITTERDTALSSIASLESQIAGLQAEANDLRAQLDAQIIETEKATDRYTDLLKDFQTALIKGTKEGIERASLSAQVTGFQAQKETLVQQLSSQQDIVKSLQQAAVVQQQVADQVVAAKENEVEAAKQTSLLSLVDQRPQFQVKGTVAWAAKASNKNKKPDFPVYYDDRKKGNRGVLSGMAFEWFNMGEESVTLNVTEEVKKKGKWLNGVPSSVTIPKSPDGGSTPGKKAISFSRGSAGRGTWETNIKFKNATTQEEFVMKTHYWQARRRRST